MTRHYPDLASASDWLKRAGTSFQPIRSTTKIWAVTRHQYGISALVTQMSFCEGSNGDLAKRRLFSQASSQTDIGMRMLIRRNVLKTGLLAIFFRRGGGGSGKHNVAV